MLLTVLNSLDAQEEITIGFEATSHYALNLKQIYQIISLFAPNIIPFLTIPS